MAEVKYTPAQRTAVYWGGGNLLLSAAAGSGKTAALTGRIVELVKNGADLNEMLVVTYTNAAAGEMRGRISSALAKAADGGDNPSVTRAISKVASAQISTIHSFLYRSLRSYFPVLGLPQDSRIADTKLIASMRSDVMSDVVNRHFSADDDTVESFTLLSDIIGQVRETSSIDNELLWIADRLTSAGKNQSALLEYADALERGDLINGEFGMTIKTSLSEFFDHYLKIFLVFREEFDTLPLVDKSYGPELNKLVEWLDRGRTKLREENFLDSMRQHFESIKFEDLIKLSKKDACDSSEAFKFFRTEIKKVIPQLKKNFLFHTETEALEQAHRTAAVLRLAAQVVGEFFEEFSKKKREASLLDYGDLETLALRLLIDEGGNPTSAALEIGAKYKYVFIDEYQDTNRVQDTIFRAISGNAKRFMVGDIKQAIYRFRGANPEVFSEYRRAWDVIEPIESPEDATYEEFSVDSGVSLFMSENFRCDSPVVNLVNKVSDYILPHGGIPYENRDSLVYAKNEGQIIETSPAAEICLIDAKSAKGKGEEDDEEAEISVSGDPEAEYVAQRIASMLGKYSPHGDKIIRESDIAILLRSPKENAPAYRYALSKRGIASAIKVEKPLSTSPAVMLLFCILNFIDNPLRDIYVTGALRSPVFSFSMSELVSIREEAPKSPLYLGIVKRAGAGDDELSRKCKDSILWLEKQKTVSRGMRVDKYLEYLLDEISLFSINGIREKGGERDAVNRFCATAADFERGCSGVGSRADLSSFLEYAADAINSKENNSSGIGGDGKVSIMSIHASKGLEFPVCFVSGCGKSRNASDENRTILYHGKLGFAMYLPDDSRLMKCDTLLRRVLAERIRRDSINEGMRMLYVALTRAREHLIVTAKVSNADKKLTTAALQREFSDSYHVTGINRYIDWILEAISNGVDEKIKLSVVSSDSVVTAQSEEMEESTASAVTEEELAEYKRRLEFEYPEEYLSSVPSKLTVSRLNPQILDEDEISLDAHSRKATKDANETDESPLKRPSFMAEAEIEPVTAAERGTATHVFMQFVDFAALKNGGVRAEIERMIEEGFISRTTADMINVKQMERFANSGLLDKMLRSPMVKREFRFNARLDASRFTSNDALSEKLKENGVKVTVQGVVDCVFRDPDTGVLVLIDYKTDSLTDEEWKDQSLAEAKLRSRHKEQLSYYREICSEMFSEDIPSAYVYSTHLGRVIEI